MQIRQFRKMGRYCNHYYEKVTEAMKLKCGYDFDYIIKYVSREKFFGNCNYKLVIFCFVNNIFITHCCTITNRPIDLKLGLNIRSRVMHVLKEPIFRNSNYKLLFYAI